MPQPKAPERPRLDPHQSYNLLLEYQSSRTPSPQSSTSRPQLSSSQTSLSQDAEWHDLVDESVRESLGNLEVKRQGLWWELIKGEADYVKDLRVMRDVSRLVRPSLTVYRASSNHSQRTIPRCSPRHLAWRPSFPRCSAPYLISLQLTRSLSNVCLRGRGTSGL